jgi:hypothetical protein
VASRLFFVLAWHRSVAKRRGFNQTPGSVSRARSRPRE